MAAPLPLLDPLLLPLPLLPPPEVEPLAPLLPEVEMPPPLRPGEVPPASEVGTDWEPQARLANVRPTPMALVICTTLGPYRLSPERRKGRGVTVWRKSRNTSRTVKRIEARVRLFQGRRL